jgi:leucine dehydrogenase
MFDFFEELSSAGAHRILALQDKGSGLRAFIALDDTTLGPACGGIRTLAYNSTAEALTDVAKLASAMTLKCAIAGLDAGGGKAVVMLQPEMDRAAAFRRLGDFIEDLGGLFRTAGDLGTTYEDLLQIAKRTSHVNTSSNQLSTATGQGIVNCIRACASDRGLTGLDGLQIAVQGCGLIGSGVARSLAAQGAKVTVADVDENKAKILANEIGGKWITADKILTTEVDIISPCAVGGVVTPQIVNDIRAWAICGGANNQLSDKSVDALLAARGIAYVPDFLASSGAVIDGIARTVMNSDPNAFIARLEETALLILQQARKEGSGTDAIGRALALSRINKVNLRALQTH